MSLCLWRRATCKAEIGTRIAREEFSRRNAGFSDFTHHYEETLRVLFVARQKKHTLKSARTAESATKGGSWITRGEKLIPEEELAKFVMMAKIG